MAIALGSDHGGFELKNEIKKHLEDLGLAVQDFGTHTKDSVDYPDIAEAVAVPVAAGAFDFGILVCGTGIGISIAANKVNGIRAAHCTDAYSAAKAKEHNNANIICLGGRITGVDLALTIVDAYLGAEFEGGRHQNRVDKIMALEK
ncbi:MAG: ribose 5-phosphate isomerase B [Clostridia bacterium]|nr:ribose 5-phosphate isomerase B [Clostridia bacterium]